MPWKFPPVSLPPRQQLDLQIPDPIDEIRGQEDLNEEVVESVAPPIPVQVQDTRSSLAVRLPWAALGSLLLALIAQNSLEPGPARVWWPGLVFYLMALACLALAIYRQEWSLASIPDRDVSHPHHSVRLPELIIGIILSFLVFLTSGGNRFTILNILLLVSSLLLIIRAFWDPISEIPITQKIAHFIHRQDWKIKFSAFSLLLLGSTLLIVFFRFYNLQNTPAEMNSDHAEKILDIYRVLAGQTNIFFPTNGGREALQMYLVAGFNRFLGIPLNFDALKFSMALVGFLSLFFIYGIGKEIASPRVGLLAFVFAGIAYWPNVVSRFGLRLPFYFLFTAALMYFLIRGLLRNSRNDFIYAGITLGLSFYGYTADRILPFVVICLVGMYLIHRHSKDKRQATLISLAGLVLISVIFFMPMFRYMVDNPGAFLYRSLSRVGSIERVLPGPAWLVFLGNLGRAMVMFSWSNGEVWTLSIPYRPALEIVTGALYWIGFFLVFVRYLRKRHWLDVSLLMVIPILMLPSIMALAFPAENPNLYRTGGVLVPVFLLIGLALDGLLRSLEQVPGKFIGQTIAWCVTILLLFWAATQSYDLVFRQYDQQYRLSAWNSSEMGSVIQSFGEIFHVPENAWVVAYPYWVDTRLVGMLAGDLTRDVAIQVGNLVGTLSDHRPKLFLVKPEDEKAVAVLNQLYPEGWFTEYQSKVPSKEFLLFFVPMKP